MTNEKIKRMFDACYQAKRIREMLPSLPPGVMPSYIQYLDVIQKLRDLFGLYVKIGDRAVKILDYDYEFSGKEKNIAEITVDVGWMDRIEHKTDAPVIENVELEQKWRSRA